MAIVISVPYGNSHTQFCIISFVPRVYYQFLMDNPSTQSQTTVQKAVDLIKEGKTASALSLLCQTFPRVTVLNEKAPCIS